ncbi:MAG: MFS transporter [Patescibacteria group bacterium]
MPIKNKAILILYTVAFFSAIHYALTLYIESSFLEGFLSDRYVGLFYAVAFFMSIVVAVRMPWLLSRFGNYRVTLALILFEVISLFGLSVVEERVFVLFLFVFHQIMLVSLSIAINIFLESFSADESTGQTRGVFLTIINVAILTGPLVATLFSKNGNYDILFLVSSLFTIPMFVLIAINFKNYRDPIYNKFLFLKTLVEVARNRAVYRICMSRFLLEFFYSIMIVFTPIYLHKYLGIPISDILGIIMPVALIPFVVFPYILGIIADIKIGEKEMLVLGVVILSIATMSLSFITATTVLVWTVLMLLTRVGASIVESMTETYFFKKVNATDSNLIAFFSNLRPMAFMVGPLAATVFLSVFDMRYIFLALGIFMFLGLRYSLTLKDTR